MIIRTLKLTSLFVNTENYRFEPLASQKEAIDRMVEDQGDKLYFLGLDIITNGLNPIDLIMVTPTEDNRYIVLEGNRRVTALKLLNNPTLIADKYSSLRKKFQKLLKDSSDAILQLRSIDCAIFESPLEADIWIKRKHSGELNGIGTVTWNSQQKQRFEERTEGKSSIPLQIISLLKSYKNVPQDIKDALPKLNITNLQRLIADPYVREQIGVDINNGLLVSKIEISEVIKGFVKIISDILDPQFKVANIYNREKRKEYIDKLDKSQKPDLSKEATSLWSVQDFGENRVKVSTVETDLLEKKQNPLKEKARTSLIPKSLKIEIENPKIKKIFDELRTIPIRTCPNASSVLLRVFLELSIDAYLEKCKIVNNGALTACSSNESLQGKVGRVLNHLTQKKKISNDLSKGIRAEVHDENSVLSVESLNAYVHNEFFYPKADNLLIGWDNIEKFFIILWDAINNKE